MKTKMVMSITVDPKLKADFYRAVKTDGLSHVVSARGLKAT